MKTKILFLCGITSACMMILARIYYMLMLFFNPWNIFESQLEKDILPVEYYFVFTFLSLFLLSIFSATYAFKSKIFLVRVVSGLLAILSVALLPFFGDVVFDGLNFGFLEILFIFHTFIFSAFTSTFYFSKNSNASLKAVALVSSILFIIVSIVSIMTPFIDGLGLWQILFRVFGEIGFLVLMLVIYKQYSKGNYDTSKI